jgi:hypothetical protein
MALTESRIRRIILEELQQELNEQGFLNDLAAGASGAVQGAVTGAMTGGLSGAVKGVVSGAQAGIAANQAVVQAANALRERVSQGDAVGMSELAKNVGNLLLYLMDWGGNPNDPGSSGRAMWALLKFITTQKQNFTASIPQIQVTLAVAQKDPALIAFAQAVSNATGVRKEDPRWFPTLADAIIRNKIV